MKKTQRAHASAPTPHLDRFLTEQVSPERIIEELEQASADSPLQLAWDELRGRCLAREGERAQHIAELFDNIDGMCLYEEAIP